MNHSKLMKLRHQMPWSESQLNLLLKDRSQESQENSKELRNLNQFSRLPNLLMLSKKISLNHKDQGLLVLVLRAFFKSSKLIMLRLTRTFQSFKKNLKNK